LLRFLGLLVSSITACLIFRQLRQYSLTSIQAYLAVSAMFFLPGFADIHIFGISSFYFTICLFLSAWVFDRSLGQKDNLVSILIFLFAISIYPPAAMFYWTCAGIYLLFGKERYSLHFKQNLVSLMGVGIISLLIYAISILIMHYFFSSKIGTNLYNPYVLNSHYLAKLNWFFHEPLNNALNLWNIFPQKRISFVVLSFILLSLIIFMPKKKFSSTLFWQILLFAFIFFLSFLPNLAAQGNAAFYRCLLALSSLIWFLSIWSFSKWSKKYLTIVLFILFIDAGMTTFCNVLSYRVLPSFIEWRAYQTLAKEIESSPIRPIHIMLPFHYTIERYDEFGAVSSHYLFDIYHMIYCALNDTGKPNNSIPLIYVSFPGDDKIYQLDEIFFKKLSDGKWVFKILNRDNRFHGYDHTGKITLDQGLTTLLVLQKPSLQLPNAYILDINGMFSPKNYNSLIAGTKSCFDHYVLSLNPQFSDFYYNLGIRAYQQGQLAQALDDFNRAVEINPKDSESLLDRNIVAQKIEHL